MSPDRPPQRVEVWRVAFDPALGGEIRKTRPAVVVSNDLASRGLASTLVVEFSGGSAVSDCGVVEVAIGPVG
jgi:mRNA interferase MazF